MFVDVRWWYFYEFIRSYLSALPWCQMAVLPGVGSRIAWSLDGQRRTKKSGDFLAGKFSLESSGGFSQWKPPLVGGLEHDWMIFPYIGNRNPNWRTHIFQRGRSTTNQSISGGFSMAWARLSIVGLRTMLETSKCIWGHLRQGALQGDWN